MWNLRTVTRLHRSFSSNPALALLVSSLHAAFTTHQAWLDKSRRAQEEAPRSLIDESNGNTSTTPPIPTTPVQPDGPWSKSEEDEPYATAELIRLLRYLSPDRFRTLKLEGFAASPTNLKRCEVPVDVRTILNNVTTLVCNTNIWPRESHGDNNCILKLLLPLLPNLQTLEGSDTGREPGWGAAEWWWGNALRPSLLALDTARIEYSRRGAAGALTPDIMLAPSLRSLTLSHPDVAILAILPATLHSLRIEKCILADPSELFWYLRRSTLRHLALDWYPRSLLEWLPMSISALEVRTDKIERLVNHALGYKRTTLVGLAELRVRSPAWMVLSARQREEQVARAASGGVSMILVE